MLELSKPRISVDVPHESIPNVNFGEYCHIIILFGLAIQVMYFIF